MKNIKLFLLLVILGMVLACSSTHNLKHSNTISFHTVPNDVRYNFTLGNNISGTSQVTKILGILQLPFNTRSADNVYYASASPTSSSKFISLKSILGNSGIIELAKAGAAYNACKSNNYDVIVAPIYEYQIQNFLIFKIVSATVTGRGAKITGIKIDNNIGTGESLFEPPKFDINSKFTVFVGKDKYGPVNVETLRKWKNENRINNSTKIISEDTKIEYSINEILSYF